MQKTVGIVLALVLMIGLLGACGAPASNTPSTSPGSSTTTKAPDEGEEGDDGGDVTSLVDTSQHLEMVLYFVGDVSDEGRKVKVVEELNRVLNERINVSVTWHNLYWTDYANRYPLILASDEQFDLIFTANWMNYTEHSRNGAFLALDDYFDYAPELYASVPEHFWNGMQAIDGHYYAMPATWQYPRGISMGYREDLRTKYGTPEIVDIDTLAEYYEAIAQNETGIFPFNAGLNTSAAGIYTMARGYVDNAAVRGDGLIQGSIQDPGAGWEFYYTNPDWRDFLHTMKDWNGKGYWSRSALSNDTGANTAFESGTGASWFNHYDSMRGTMDNSMKTTQAKEQGWVGRVWRVDQMQPGGKAVWITALQDCISIPRQARSPAHSVLLIELFNLDQELNDLVVRGIQGEDFMVDEDGNMYFPDPMVPFDMCGWCFRNADTFRDRVLSWDYYPEFDRLSRENTIPCANEGFRLDNTPWEDNISEFTTIYNEYHLQLALGMAADVDATLDAALARYEEAGIADYLAFVNEEWAKWWAENQS